MKVLARELKTKDIIKKDGVLYTIMNIVEDNYKNGTPCLGIECSAGVNKDKIDSYFCFKLETKVNIV